MDSQDNAALQDRPPSRQPPPVPPHDEASLGTVCLFIDYRNYFCSILQKKGLLREGAGEG